MTRRHTALVIGGGIAGPVTAMFLQRAGFEPVIYEARGEPADDAGAFLNLAPSGLRVLGQLGVVERVRASGFPCPSMIFRNARGKAIGRMDDARSAQREGLGTVIIKRGLLHQALRDEAIRRGIPFEWGKRLESVEIDARGRALARFSDGSEASGDVLLGCDGIHSRTRRAILPEAPEPQYTGLIDCGGFAPCPDLEPTDGAVSFVFGRRAFFGYFIAPTREVYWFQNTVSAEEPSRAELDSVPGDAWRQQLIALHQDDPAPVPEILQATPGAVGRWPLYDMPALARWHRGPVCLVGDAAHAVSPHGGNGASLAMEDAIVLARCLRDIPDHGRAFAAYVSARKDRVERIARQARKNGNLKAQPGPVAAWLRDLLMPLFLRLGARAVAEVHEYRVDWNDRGLAARSLAA